MNKKISLASSSRRFDKKWSSYDYLGLLLIVLWHVLCPGLGDNLHIVGRKYLSQQELLFIQQQFFESELIEPGTGSKLLLTTTVSENNIKNIS